MGDELITFQDLSRVVKRHGLAVVAITVVCAILGTVAFNFVPRKYKATSVLSIKNSYFQMPLDAGVSSELREASEMLSEKENLIQRALDDNYLTTLGDKFGIYKSPATSSARAGERDKLLKRIEILPLNPTTFQFAVTVGDPDVAAKMNQDVLDRVSDTLIAARQKSLLQYRASLKRQLDAMGLASGVPPSPVLSAEPDLLEQQLQTLQARRAMMKDYSPSHPAVRSLEKEIESLRRMIEGAKNSVAPSESVKRNVILGTSSKDHSPLYDDLMKKIGSVDIALELEKDHHDVQYLELIEPPKPPGGFIFPNLKYFAMGTLFAALAFSGVFVGYRELKHAGVIAPDTVASLLDTPLLGVLPTLVVPVDPKTLQTSRARRRLEGGRH